MVIISLILGALRPYILPAVAIAGLLICAATQYFELKNAGLKITELRGKITDLENSIEYANKQNELAAQQTIVKLGENKNAIEKKYNDEINHLSTNYDGAMRMLKQRPSNYQTNTCPTGDSVVNSGVPSATGIIKPLEPIGDSVGEREISIAIAHELLVCNAKLQGVNDFFTNE